MTATLASSAPNLWWIYPALLIAGGLMGLAEWARTRGKTGRP